MLTIQEDQNIIQLKLIHIMDSGNLKTINLKLPTKINGKDGKRMTQFIGLKKYMETIITIRAKLRMVS